MNKEILMNIFMKTIGGKVLFQNLFQNLLLISVHGMNTGGLGNPKNSGEKRVLEMINKRNPIIFDVGSHKGEYSQLVLDTINDVQLYSFEPSKYTFKFLKKNIKGAKLFNFGFSDADNFETLYNTSKGSGSSSLYKRDLSEYDSEMKLKEEVFLTTIDKFCFKNNVSKIDLLKIDVEGHELKVLQGAKDMLDKIDMVQFEMGCNVDARTYFKDFWDLLNPNYKIYRVCRNGLIEIEKYSWTNEIFQAINYLAIRR